MIPYLIKEAPFWKQPLFEKTTCFKTMPFQEQPLHVWILHFPAITYMSTILVLQSSLHVSTSKVYFQNHAAKLLLYCSYS